ncbi:MAG: tyrosine-type recombinase/integrase [Treponema sp.]|nr:tyrosine-type recombinase/integrase [Treponema sp.]
MNIQELTDEFLLYLSAVRGLSDNTCLGYKNDLVQLQSFLSPQMEIQSVTKENLLLCIGQLSKKNRSSASINRFISAVRTMFLYAVKFNHLQNNPALELKTVKLEKKLPNFMTKAEVNEICNEPEKNELLWKTRDECLFKMLYSSGCRLSEITNLKLSDFLNNYSSAVVTGKGNKQRRVFFEKDALDALEHYLSDRKKILEENGSSFTDYLFINQRGQPLTTGGIRFILSKYSGAEGTKHHVNPHAFRHTFATTMLSNGADIRLVQEMLGHSSISTTQRYTHITTEQLIETYNKAHPHGKNFKE